MTTDNKTLADVQPGGRVRLGDKAERARFEAWAEGASLNIARFNDGGYCDERTVSAWLAWLSAQPSPGGQGDARAQFEAWAESAGWYAVAYRPDRDAPYALNAVEFAWQAFQAALAASQPVGEPVAWMTHHDEPMLFPTAAEAAAYCEDDEQPVPLFRSPAQAVDLGQFVPDPKTVPDCFAEDDSDAQYNSGWNDCRDAVLALIDKAVQP